jgi:hypothetical protein
VPIPSNPTCVNFIEKKLVFVIGITFALADDRVLIVRLGEECDSGHKANFRDEHHIAIRTIR